MRTDEITRTLENLFGELMHGVSGKGGFMLNVGDRGLLRSLERLSAPEASAATRTGSSIAAHVAHVAYGLSLLNRWSQGENPFTDADWAASWKKVTVTEPEWEALRIQLRDEAAKWLVVLRTPREVADIELSGMIGSIAHLAYHLGAIRQINAVARGPAEGER
ncbi:MAG: DinB family protein [Vicinamibacterales bacterium]